MPVQQKPDRGNAAKMPTEEIEIAKFWANRKGEAIIVRLVAFEGAKFFVDARRHYTDSAGKFAPTAKAVMLPIRKLSELTKALAKAEAEARSRGLLDDGSDE